MFVTPMIAHDKFVNKTIVIIIIIVSISIIIIVIINIIISIFGEIISINQDCLPYPTEF